MKISKIKTKLAHLPTVGADKALGVELVAHGGDDPSLERAFSMLIHFILNTAHTVN